MSKIHKQEYEMALELLESVAMKEMALSRLLNAQGEKMQEMLWEYKYGKIDFRNIEESLYNLNSTLVNIVMEEWLLINKLNTIKDFITYRNFDIKSKSRYSRNEEQRGQSVSKQDNDMCFYAESRESKGDCAGQDKEKAFYKQKKWEEMPFQVEWQVHDMSESNNNGDFYNANKWERHYEGQPVTQQRTDIDGNCKNVQGCQNVKAGLANCYFKAVGNNDDEYIQNLNKRNCNYRVERFSC